MQALSPIKAFLKFLLEGLLSLAILILRGISSVKNREFTHACNGVLCEILWELCRVFDNMRIATSQREVDVNIREILRDCCPNTTLRTGLYDLLVLSDVLVFCLIERLLEKGTCLTENRQLNWVSNQYGMRTAA